MLSDRCLVCLSCNVGVLWPNGWMDQDATWYRDGLRPMRHCVMGWGLGTQPPLSAHVYCDQTPSQSQQLLSSCSTRFGNVTCLYAVYQPHLLLKSRTTMDLHDGHTNDRISVICMSVVQRCRWRLQSCAGLRLLRNVGSRWSFDGVETFFETDICRDTGYQNTVRAKTFWIRLRQDETRDSSPSTCEVDIVSQD